MKPIAGTEFALKADLVLLAMGFLGPVQRRHDQGPRRRASTSAATCSPTPTSYQTSLDKVFACGDMRRGQSLVVWAIREGRQARARGRRVPDGRERPAAVAAPARGGRTRTDSRYLPARILTAILRRASLMRVCQPRPPARKCSITSSIEAKRHLSSLAWSKSADRACVASTSRQTDRDGPDTADASVRVVRPLKAAASGSDKAAGVDSRSLLRGHFRHTAQSIRGFARIPAQFPRLHRW